MKKYLVKIPYEYLDGYLRNGHGEAIIKAESIEEVKEKVKEWGKYDFNCIVDDYRVNDQGNLDYKNMTVEEIK